MARLAVASAASPVAGVVASPVAGVVATPVAGVAATSAAAVNAVVEETGKETAHSNVAVSQLCTVMTLEHEGRVREWREMHNQLKLERHHLLHSQNKASKEN